MKNKKSHHEKEEAFDPDSVFMQMSELLAQVKKISDHRNKETENQKLEINKEIYRLSKLNKDYFKSRSVKIKKKSKGPQ